MSLVDSVRAILEGEKDPLVSMAHINALVYHEMSDLNWVGFYLLKGSELVVGPYQGKLACTRIALGSGVCGVAAQERKTLKVDDVDSFAGHIRCDAASKSEVVVPIVVNNDLFGVFDVDSPNLARFTDEDVSGLEAVVRVLKSVLEK